MKFRFPIVIIDEDFRAENTSGLGIRALAQAIESEGFEVLGVTSYGDLSQFAQQQSRASAFILSIDDEEFTPGPDLDPAVLNLRSFIEQVRRKNAEVPIYIYGETRTSRHIPNDILRELHGFIHMFEDTPEFVARHIIRECKSYLEGVQPPFFKALIDYAEDGSYSWHCPGHSGGVAFLKSPVGQMFHQFYGENMLRADVCNAVEELGQLLDHTGPVAASERNAARIFNCDHLYFVTNGTSTSNKIVWHSTVAPGDSVVVEITEGLLLDTSAGVADTLLALRAAGIGVSLDDFGTGYSSLSYLQKFDIDFVKIDQSFVRHLTVNSTDLALCKAIVVMAHALDMRVIAEGVETVQQRDLLAEAGCDFAQGYWYAQPMKAADFEAFVASYAASTQTQLVLASS